MLNEWSVAMEECEEMSENVVIVVLLVIGGVEVNSGP
jgi:hypothetical protein